MLIGFWAPLKIDFWISTGCGFWSGLIAMSRRLAIQYEMVCDDADDERFGLYWGVFIFGHFWVSDGRAEAAVRCDCGPIYGAVFATEAVSLPDSDALDLQRSEV